MSASLINGHDDDCFDNVIYVDGVEIFGKNDAVKKHICEECQYFNGNFQSGTNTCRQSCYSAALIVRHAPTDQYFWCKGRKYNRKK